MEGQNAQCEITEGGNHPIILSSDEELENGMNTTHENKKHVTANTNSAEKLRSLLCADKSESQDTAGDSPIDGDNLVIPLCSYTSNLNIKQNIKKGVNYQSDRSLNNNNLLNSGIVDKGVHSVRGNNGVKTARFAYDTSLCVLKLAHKLRLTRERVAKKRYLGPASTRIKDLLSKKSYKQQETKIVKAAVLTNDRSDRTNHQKIVPVASTQKALSLSGQHNISKMTTCQTQVKVSVKQPTIATQKLKLFPLPTVPKKSVDFLTSLKVSSYENGQAIAETEDYVNDLPDCGHLPLWPLFGSNKESAAKREIPPLSEYIERTESLAFSSNGKVKTSNGASHKSRVEELVQDVPDPLTDTQLDAIEKAAVATVLSTNLPRTARKAYEMTRNSFEGCKRIVNHNILKIAAAVAACNNSGKSAGNVSILKQQLNTPAVSGAAASAHLNNIQKTSPYTVSLLKSSSPNLLNLHGAVRVSRPNATNNPNSLLLSQQKVPIQVPGPAGNSNVVLLVKDVNSAFNSVELVTVHSPNQRQPKQRSSNTTERNDEVRVQDVDIIKKEEEAKRLSSARNTAQASESSATKSMPRKFQCSQCGYQTDNRSHLRRHESSVHSGDKLYCCYVCKKEFARSEKCRSHIMKTHPEVGYDHRFIRKDKYQSGQVCQLHSKKQMRLEEEDEEEVEVKVTPFTSTPIKKSTEPLKRGDVAENVTHPGSEDVCEVSNGSHATTLWEHAKDHSNVSNASSQEEGALDLSVTSNKVNVQDSPTRMFRCQICFYIGKDACNLKRHIADVHNNKKAFRCRKCNYVTSRKHRLISHMKSHGKLYCIHCDFSTTDYTDFSHHLKHCIQQQRAGSMACELCRHPCFNRKILADHMHRVHQMELWCCELCSFTCSDEARFLTHEQEHFKVDCSATCNKCKVTFDKESTCVSHILRFHKGDPEYEEEVFEESCVRETGEVYQCLVCKYETEHKPVMKNHIDMHLRNRYLCEVTTCTFSCTSKKDMRAHQKDEHAENNENNEEEGANRKNASLVKVEAVKEEEDMDVSVEIDSNLNVKGPDDIIYDADTGGLIGHGSGRWNCMICPDKPPFRYRRSYEKHMSRHRDPADHTSDREEGSIYTCSLCTDIKTNTFLSVDDLEKHRQTVHHITEGAMETNHEQEGKHGNWLEIELHQSGGSEGASNGQLENDGVLNQGEFPPQEKDEAWTRRNSVQDWINQQQLYLEDVQMSEGRGQRTE